MDEAKTLRLRAAFEEELGEFAPVAHLSTAAIEELAMRLTRAIEPIIDVSGRPATDRAA